jgi:hypothetical protein
MTKKTLIGGAAMVAAMMLAPAAYATTYFSGSTTASATGSTPVIDFTAPGGTAVDVTVTDCCVVGDYYATFVDGSYLGTTPYEPEYGSGSGYPNSSATFMTTLSAGTSHDFQLVDQTDFYLPAGLSVVIADAPAVPEPTSWAMMLVGTLGIGAALRRNGRMLKRQTGVARLA